MGLLIGTLYQYDSNQTASVSDSADVVHWQLTSSETTLTTPIIDGVAEIPDIILHSYGKKQCWTYDTINSRTVNGYVFEVRKRQKPGV